MNKLLYGVIVLLLLPLSSVLAQKHKIELGLETGPAYTTLYGFDLAGDHPYYPYNPDYVGAIRAFSSFSLQYNINEKYSIRSGVAFERKGDLIEYQAIDPSGIPLNDGELKIFHSYFTVPVLLRAHFGEKSRFFLNAGPFLGIAFDNYYTTETYVYGQRGYEDTNIEEDLTEFYKNIDWGFTLGAGVLFPLSNKFDLSLEARNNLGLFNISEDSGIQIFAVEGKNTVKTNSFNLLFGVFYKFGQAKSVSE